MRMVQADRSPVDAGQFDEHALTAGGISTPETRLFTVSVGRALLRWRDRHRRARYGGDAVNDQIVVLALCPALAIAPFLLSSRILINALYNLLYCRKF